MSKILTHIDNDWSGGMSINEFKGQPNSFQQSQNIDARGPNGGFTLASNRYEATISSRIVAFFRNYGICDDGTVYQLNPNDTGFTSVGNLGLTGVLNLCEFQGYIYFARTSGLSRITVTDFLSQTFGTLVTNFITYSVKTGTNYTRITTTTNAQRIPYVDTGSISGGALIDRDGNDVATYNTGVTTGQYYIFSTSGSTLNNGPYAFSYQITASMGGATKIPMLNYYDDKLIFAIGNKVLYIQDLGNYVYLGMNLVVGQTVSGITASGGYVKIYAVQDNKDTKVHFWRGGEVSSEGNPAKPEQTVPLDGYVVRNIASEGSMDYLMAGEPDNGGNPDLGTSHFFIGQGSTFYKIKSGKFLRRGPTQDYHFLFRQLNSNLAIKNGIVYIPCGDGLYSYGTLHKDIPPSLQKDFELRASGPNRILPFAIHQYNGTVYMSYQAQDATLKIMKYAQDFESASYEESGYLISRVFTGGSLSDLKRIEALRLGFEFETTPDGVEKSGSGGTINFYLRNNRNSAWSLVKAIADSNYKGTQTMRVIIKPNEIPFQDFYMLEYKVELIRGDQAKTPHYYETLINYTVINE